MSPEEIVKYIAESYCLKPDILKSKNRLPYVVEPRDLAVYILTKVKKFKSREVLKLLNINYPKMSYCNKRITEKLKDPDYREFFSKLLAKINEKQSADDLIRGKELKEFQNWCQERGMCLIAPILKIPTLSLARKYKLTTANQLYHVLKTGKYANRSEFIRMHKDCLTENCVKHWKFQEEEEFLGVDIGEKEEEIVFSPEESLIYAIINSAIEENDEKYFKSGLFTLDLLQLGVENSKIINKMLEKKNKNLAKLSNIGYNKIKRLLGEMR